MRFLGSTFSVSVGYDWSDPASLLSVALAIVEKMYGGIGSILSLRRRRRRRSLPASEQSEFATWRSHLAVDRRRGNDVGDVYTNATVSLNDILPDIEYGGYANSHKNITNSTLYSLSREELFREKCVILQDAQSFADLFLGSIEEVWMMANTAEAFSHATSPLAPEREKYFDGVLPVRTSSTMPSEDPDPESQVTEDGNGKATVTVAINQTAVDLLCFEVDSQLDIGNSSDFVSVGVQIALVAGMNRDMIELNKAAAFVTWRATMDQEILAVGWADQHECASFSDCLVQCITAFVQAFDGLQELTQLGESRLLLPHVYGNAVRLGSEDLDIAEAYQMVRLISDVLHAREVGNVFLRFAACSRSCRIISHKPRDDRAVCRRIVINSLSCDRVARSRCFLVPGWRGWPCFASETLPPWADRPIALSA
eukprot:m.278483 g.278483  ORF g.278483 m.278483 type:complete len:425 (-) comp11101_c0_seq98:5365-6639(-)